MMIKRKFIPGSEWLYLKIYTGVKTADLILDETIKPLLENFREKNYVTMWFFIRYYDPKSHLRVRFKLSNSQYYNEVLNTINTICYKYIESGEVSNIAIDTYNREVERYGENTIEEAETLFYLNSNFTLQCLDYDDEEKIIASFFYINTVLDKINLSIHEKLVWIKNYNDSFKKEFNGDKKLNTQLDKKYREFKPKYIGFLQSEEFIEERNAIILNIDDCNFALKNILIHHENQSLEMTLQDFFQSIFHMNINRLFVSNQRFFEMIIYDYLLRYYKTLVYQTKQNS